LFRGGFFEGRHRTVLVEMERAGIDMTSEISFSAEIVAFNLVLGSLEGGISPRSVGAMLSLHEDHQCRLELDVDANPYGIPFHVRFEPGEARLSDGSPMPIGCGAFGFVAAFTPRHADIDPASASLTLRISLPGPDFEALWSVLATGRQDLRATVRFSAGPFDHALPPVWRWKTTLDSHLLVSRASVAFAGPGWPSG
jgi:hypothetical protein